jgi:DNA-binding beta-propeller fold protein YncE
MNHRCPYAAMFGLALWLGHGAVHASDPDALQASVSIGAVAYDDGFGLTLKEPSGIWFDTLAGEVFVADAGNGRVVIYDRWLTFKYSFRHFVKDAGSGRTVAGQPKGMAVNSSGEILLNDAITEQLDLLDFRGRVIESANPKLLLGDTTLHLKTSCLTVDVLDRFYVVVNGDLATILVLNQDLDLVLQIGAKGDSAHQFNTPVAIGVNHGRIYVGDLYGLPAVKVYDTLGQYVFGFGAHDVERADLTFPTGFGFISDASGARLILVPDGLRQTVKVYTETGEFFTMIGGYGRLPGFLQYPSGIASDGHAMFYVVERAGRRIQLYETR